MTVLRSRLRGRGPALSSACLAVVLTLSACSAGSTPSGAPSGAPTTTASASSGVAPSPTDDATPSSATATPTIAPTAAATSAAPPSSTPTAAATPAGPVDVEALVPTEVAGITLAAETVSVADFIGAFDTFPAMLGVLGKSADDVTIVQAQGSNPQAGEVVIVQAFRVAGADATALMNGFLEFWKVSNDVASPITIGGKQLIVQGHPDTEAQYKSYYYGYGDVVFRLGYNGDNFDAAMAELVGKLP